MEAYRAFHAANGQARETAAQHYFEVFRQEMPFIPLGFARDVLLTSPGLARNITPSEQDPFYNMENWSAVSAN